MEANTKEIQTNLADWFKGGLNLYKENFVIVFVCCLIAIILSCISVFVLAGPLFVGIMMILFRLIEKSSPAPTIPDIFQGLNQFKASFIFIIAWGLINWFGSYLLSSVPGIGGILSFAYSSALGGLIVFGLPIIADKKLDFFAASQLSIDTVKPKLAQFVLFSFIGSIITISGFLLLGIGIFFTLPIYSCAIAVAYKDVFGIQST